MSRLTVRVPGPSAVATALAVISLGAFTAPLAWAGDAQAGAGATAQPAADTQAAVWTPKEVQFTYMGFTSTYTCDGLRDTIREMLLHLGARKDDLQVYEQPCSGNPDRPNPFPGVRIKMSVLTPAPASPGADVQTVPAQWKSVKLPYPATGLQAEGECELLEQFKEKVLPLFTTRNVDLHATCIPHQLSPLGTQLQAQVLITDQKKPGDRQAAAADAR